MDKKVVYDYLIIGAGPAGLQLGYFLEKEKRNYLILEAGNSPGVSFKVFPRHKKLLSINKVYSGYNNPEINLRWDWHSLLSGSEKILFKDYSKDYFPETSDYVRYLGDFAQQFNLKIEYETQVVHVTKDDIFNVLDSTGKVYACEKLVVATGVSKAYIPDIDGIELTENYTNVSVDPENFVNQKVLIIGKGNSGFETADNLISTAAVIHLISPSPITMAWKSHFVGNLRAVNNNILDTYQLKSQNAILNASIEKIKNKNGKFEVLVSYSNANDETEYLLYDRVITCTGFRFDDSIFDNSCKPKMTIDDRFPALTSEWQSVNVNSLYFAGTLMQMRDYKKTNSAFIHGFRYNVSTLHHIFDYKYEGKSWPHKQFNSTSENLTDIVIERLNETSALWQQFSYICDLIVISCDDNTAYYYYELTMDYVQDSEFGQYDHYYIISLEYGPKHDYFDPFNTTRIERHDTEHADQSNFLHPVIRRYNGSTLISVHHIIEDLAAEWLEPEHINPLLDFFRNDLSLVVSHEESSA